MWENIAGANKCSRRRGFNIAGASAPVAPAVPTPLGRGWHLMHPGHLLVWLGGRRAGSKAAVKRPGRAMTRTTLVVTAAFLVTQLPFYVVEILNAVKADYQTVAVYNHITWKFNLQTFLEWNMSARLRILTDCAVPFLIGLFHITRN